MYRDGGADGLGAEEDRGGVREIYSGNISFTEMSLCGSFPFPPHTRTPRAALGGAPGGVVLHNLTPGCIPAHKSFVLLMANIRRERKAESHPPPSFRVNATVRILLSNT